MFSFGNILAVGSTIFLVGPRKQIKMMFDPVRVFATVAYVICVIFALVCALWVSIIAIYS
nr:vesicle transport protein SFT2B [Ipomoea batatas]